MPRQHSPAFTAVRDLIVALDDRQRARLSRLFGSATEPQAKLGPAVRAALRAIATLDDTDLERLARWFAAYVNQWGQIPAASGRGIESGAYRGKAPPK